jgi:hypothetical protein
MPDGEGLGTQRVETVRGAKTLATRRGATFVRAKVWPATQIFPWVEYHVKIRGFEGAKDRWKRTDTEQFYSQLNTLREENGHPIIDVQRAVTV